MTSRFAAGAVVCLAGVALQPTARAQAPKSQEKGRKIVSWAPVWKVGDGWVVETFQRDLGATFRSSRAPSEKKGKGKKRRFLGGTPDVPEDPHAKARAADIPGFPALRNGVPQGFKRGNTFRFEVVRKASVSYPDDAPQTPPEVFWVVRVEAKHGPARRAELWYATSDLALSKVVFQPKTKRAREMWLNGSVQLGIPASEALGVPLDWPNFRAAKRQPKARLRIDGRSPIEQLVVERKATLVAGGAYWIRLREVSSPAKSPKQPRVLVRAVLKFQPGLPFWKWAQTQGMIARLKDRRGE